MNRTFPLAAFAMLIFSLLANTVSAQEQETLFASPIEHGGFGGVVTKMTPIRGEMALMVGGYGGWLINHQLMLGGGGYALVTDVRASTEAEQVYAEDNEPLYVDFGYGGVMIEYIFTPGKLVHFNVQALIGAGVVSYREAWQDVFNSNYHSMSNRYGESVFVAEPSVNVEVNVTEWLRLSAGAGYRFVSGLNELKGIENKDLSGPSGSITLKFGAF